MFVKKLQETGSPDFKSLYEENLITMDKYSDPLQAVC